MQIALNKNNERIHIDDAVRHGIYYCQTCGSRVDVKKGPQRMHHFSHSRNSERPNCEDWNHEKTDWHISWQNLFPIDCQEVSMTNEEGLRHIADVFVDDKIVEFQHSSMSVEEFNKRSDFYTSLGKLVIWLFDVRNANIDEQQIINRILLKKGIQAISGYDPDNDNIMIFIQISGSDIASAEDTTSEIRRIVGKDGLGFKTDLAITSGDFASFVNGDISYEKLMKNKEKEKNLPMGKPLRRVMGLTIKPLITAKNVMTEVEVRVENSEEVFNAERITGQLKVPGWDTFTTKIYPIDYQNDPVWIMT